MVKKLKDLNLLKIKIIMNINKTFLKDSLGWGVLLWLIGWVLGVVAFMIVPVGMIGWVVSPIATLVTVWVLIKKVNGEDLRYYFGVALVWTLIAIIFDYLFLVKLFNPADGYYKADVYFYYITTFVLPLAVGFFKIRKTKAVGNVGA